MEMFTCTQYSAPVTMTKRACVLRQQRIAAWQGVMNIPGQANRDNMDHETVLSFNKCLDCRQGKENAMEPTIDTPAYLDGLNLCRVPGREEEQGRLMKEGICK